MSSAMNIHPTNEGGSSSGVKKATFTPGALRNQNVNFSTELSSAMSKSASSGNHTVMTQMKGKEGLEAIFQKASATYQVPINLLKAVAYAESGFRSDAVSSCGAQGIMQLMPATSKSLGVTNPFDPEQNIMAGTKCLAEKLKEYQGDIPLTLASYNAGSGNVRKYGGIPPFEETKKYIKKVMGLLGQDLQISDTSNTSNTSNTSHSTKHNVMQPSSLKDFVAIHALDGNENSLLLRQIEVARNSDWMMKYQEIIGTIDNPSKEKDS